MRKVKLLDFVDKFVSCDFIVWCPDFSNELYDRDEIFETQVVKNSDEICIFDYFIVDDVCVNGCLQINCHFNSRSYYKHIKDLQKQVILDCEYPYNLLDLIGDMDE